MLSVIHSINGGFIMARQYVSKQIRDINATHPHHQPRNVPSHTRHSDIRPPAVSPKGAPPIYDPIRFPHMANVLCKEYGFNTLQMGEVFGVSKKTVESWLVKHPEFKVAVKSGRDAFDSCKVESALLKIALGYEYEERSVKTISVRGSDSEGKTIRVPAKETTITTKMLPPNAKAIAFWLTNRDRERWKMESTVKAEITSNTTHTENTLSVTADLTKMDSNQLRALRELVSTQTRETIEVNKVEEIPMFDVISRANAIREAEEAQYTE